MGFDQIKLKLRPLLMSYYFVSEVSKPCVDAINYSFGVTHHFLNNLSAFMYFVPSGWSKIDFPVFINDSGKHLRSECISIDAEDLIDIGRLS